MANWKLKLELQLNDRQVVEQTELEDENSSIQLSSKSAKGRKTVKKGGVSEDTKPSNFGRRIEPVIHQKFKTAAAAHAKKRKLQEVSALYGNFFFFTNCIISVKLIINRWMHDII